MLGGRILLGSSDVTGEFKEALDIGTTIIAELTVSLLKKILNPIQKINWLCKILE